MRGWDGRSCVREDIPFSWKKKFCLFFGFFASWLILGLCQTSSSQRSNTFGSFPVSWCENTKKVPFMGRIPVYARLWNCIPVFMLITLSPSPATKERRSVILRAQKKHSIFVNDLCSVEIRPLIFSACWGNQITCIFSLLPKFTLIFTQQQNVWCYSEMTH